MKRFNLLYEQILEEMNRRDFLKTLGKGAKVAVGTSIIPKGLIGKAVTGLSTSKSPINLINIISKYFLNNPFYYADENYGGYLEDIKDAVTEADHINQKFNNIITALKTNDLPIPPSLVTAAQSILNGIGDLTGSIEMYKDDPEEYPLEVTLDSCEQIINDLYQPDGIMGDFNNELVSFGYKNNLITSQAQQHLESDSNIYKCDYVKDPASEARKTKAEAEANEMGKKYQKQLDQLNYQNIAKNIDYSRMDKAGSSEDEGYAKYYENYLKENYADGKNPGRKGLAKRSGVNTKASVSSLRKTAKNSSGEKARMAHWMANMKAGKKKAKK